MISQIGVSGVKKTAMPIIAAPPAAAMIMVSRKP